MADIQHFSHDSNSWSQYRGIDKPLENLVGLSRDGLSHLLTICQPASSHIPWQNAQDARGISTLHISVWNAYSYGPYSTWNLMLIPLTPFMKRMEKTHHMFTLGSQRFIFPTDRPRVLNRELGFAHRTFVRYNDHESTTTFSSTYESTHAEVLALQEILTWVKAWSKGRSVVPRPSFPSLSASALH